VNGPILEIEKLSKHFGGLAAVSEVSLEVRPGEIVGLIGPNGAGKTTVFNVLSGVLKPTRGRIVFKGEDITGLAAHRVAQRGLVRCFQLPTLFDSFSVRDNLVLAAAPRLRRDVDRESRKRADELLRFFALDSVGGERVRNLPYGFQKMLEIAMALAGGPDLVLLDEPFCGLTAGDVDSVSQRLIGLRRQGVTMMIVEHNMRALMARVDRVYVLNFGRHIAEGTPEEIARNPEVIRAYLGSSGGARRASSGGPDGSTGAGHATRG
jgi:branched-chain amino acid transport system ATP-binding protein